MIKTNSINLLKLLITFLILIFWPLGFFLRNGALDFFHYFIPTLFLSSVYLLYLRNKHYGWALAILIIILLTFLFFGGTSFKNNSILYFNRTDEQTVLREGYLYPKIWMSRLFQNKPAIYWNRFKFNFFALVDPSNYFFGFHPRETKGENQNLQKFPSFSILLFSWGLYLLTRSNKWKFIAFSFIPLILILSVIKNFDKYDLILYLPFSLIFLYGLDKFLTQTNKLKIGYLAILFLFTLVEYIQMIVSLTLNK